MSGLLQWLTEMLGDRTPASGTRLAEVVDAALPEADEEARRLVVAVAGLLATVAYADRDYCGAEEERIAQELSRVHGLDQGGVDAIRGVLREQILTIATVEAPIYARELCELADRAFRRELLDALVDIAAADEEITIAETNVLRVTTTALGLTQSDFNASQARHRDKLRILKK
ncbi:MAG TPA: TerB family tellurite resistance protein [Polyangiaceae bacterium]|nr:TerB family tellurite resistance protein [Polyangiaceae bacterium]